MTETTGETAEELDPSADPAPEEGDHPEDLSDQEADEGQVIFLEIDDVDDDSNGLV